MNTLFDTLIYYMIIDYYEITNNSFVHAAVGMTMLLTSNYAIAF